MLFILAPESSLFCRVWSEQSAVQVVLSGFSVRLLCFVQENLFVCMVVCIS